jgi:hypothetical protein
MAIEKTATPNDPDKVVNGVATEIEIEVQAPIEEEGMIIEFGDSPSGLESGFGENLAELIDDDKLDLLGGELYEHFLADKESRSEWEDTYIKGLDQLGLTVDDRTEPWPGACGVFHPMLSEAVIKFQSQAISEIFPAEGPVKTKIVGIIDEEKEKQSHRIKDYMNYLLTEKMVEYRTETEKLLFSLPLAGSAFRKVYYDSNMGRPCSIFVPAEDFVVSYGASDLLTCERATHVMKKTENEIKKLMYSGFFRDCELPSPEPDIDEITDKYNQLTGESSTSYDNDGRHTILEMQVDLDLEGFEDMANGEPTGIALPYIVTFDRSSTKILSIRRNYEENDSLKRRRQHFVHYQYLPGIGFYGFGLIHMIGGLSQSATSILRQLIDAGTLSNLPAGFKARGMNVSKLDEPLQPGEFRDVDIPGGTLRDAIMPLPYKEPSGTLAQLLGVLVDSGRRFASIADMQVGDGNQEAPVGTTIALLERGSKVMSAIHKRLHYAQKLEFKILARVFSESIPDEYPFDVAGASRSVFVQDFDRKVDVIPVSDPNIFSTSQRITMAQTQLQLAQSAPGIHNLREAYKNMYIALDVKDVDEILRPEASEFPKDPVQENQDVMMGTPLKAFLEQDHDAHIAAHTAFLQNPNVQSNAQAVAALQAHIQEHFALKYRLEVTQILAQQGMEMPPEGQPLPMEVQNAIAAQAAAATQQITGRDQAIQQAQLNAQIDPQMQMFNAQMQLEQAKLQLRQAEAQLRAQTEIERENIRADVDRERIESEENKQDARLAVNLQSDLIEKEEQRVKDLVELAKQAQEARNLPDNN